MAAATGQPAEAVVGKKAWVGLLAQRGATPLDKALSSGEGIEEHVRIVHRQTGIAQTVKFTAVPIVTAVEEDAIGAVGILSADANEAIRARSALDASTLAQMLVDTSGVITHVNPAAVELMLKHRDAFHAADPALDPAHLVGSSIERFFAKPETEMRELDARQQYDIDVRGLTFELTRTVLPDGHGKSIGSLLEWKNVTEDRAQASASLVYRQTADAISNTQAVIEFSPDGTILDANDNFLRAVQYSLTEVKGSHHRMFVEPKQAQGAEYASFWAALARGEAQSGQFKRRAKGGEEIWLQASYTPILDVRGRVFKVIKYATDITKERLRNADYEGQIAAIGRTQAVVQFELDGSIMTANDNFLAVMGYRLEDIRGKHHRMFMDPDEARGADYRSFWEALRRGEPKAGVFKRLGRNGKEVWIQASYSPIFDLDGRPFKVVKYATDITATRLQNADYQGQIEAVGKAQAVISFQLDGTIVDANDKFLNGVGYTAAEVRGRHHRMFVDSQYAQSPEYQAFWDALRRGEHQSGEYRRVGKNGKEVWLQANYNPIFDMAGRPFKIVKYATDITAQALQKRKTEQDSIAYRDEVTRVIDLCTAGHLGERGRTAGLSEFYEPMMAGINRVIDALVKPVEEAAQVLGQLARQDLTARVVGNYEGDHATIKDNVNNTAEGLERALAQVLQSASQLKAASSQISAGSQSLSQATNEQASSLEEVSSTIEQLSSMTDQNASNASQAKGLSDNARKSASIGKGAMDQLSGALDRIKGSSDQTAKIVKTIDEIAFQTNLLALNAAVEAARAGDAGKGFAVVAEEVRSLAQRSAVAAKSTAELIEGAVKNAEAGVRLGREVADQLQQIVFGSDKVNDIVAEIAAASTEQAKGIGQINVAVSQINQITQQNAANSEQSAAAAEELSAQAGQLADMVSQFHLSEMAEATAGVIPARPASAGVPPPRPGAGGQKAHAAHGGKPTRQAAKVIPLTEEELRDF